MTNLNFPKRRFITSLYLFEYDRNKYGLCSSNTGFFQPFKTAYDVQQQIKTTFVSPLVGMCDIVKGIVELIKNVLIIAISIPCMSPDLFIKGVFDFVLALVITIVPALVAIAVTLASLVSMGTRTLATFLSYDGGEFNNELLSFLPENPFKRCELI